MPSKLTRLRTVGWCALLVAAWSHSATAIEADRTSWPLIRIPDPVARATAIAGLESASESLVNGDCGKVLTDYETERGQTLADRLSSLEVDIQTYVRMVTFVDDSRHRVCEKGGLFFTSPGSRVVRVCVEALKQMRSRPADLVALFIHEVLHSLGLGESPPSSEAITARVKARCGRK
jgi:hypothetical protein